MLGCNYSSTINLLITKSSPSPEVKVVATEEAPVIESREDWGYVEDKLRGLFLCNFPLLDPKEPSYKINVDKIKDDEGQPLQIPPMGRIFAFAGIGSVLSRPFKDCRMEHVFPRGAKVSEFKMNEPAPITFKSSTLSISAPTSDLLIAPKPENATKPIVSAFTLYTTNQPVAASKGYPIFESMNFSTSKPGDSAVTTNSKPTVNPLAAFKMTDAIDAAPVKLQGLVKSPSTAKLPAPVFGGASTFTGNAILGQVTTAITKSDIIDAKKTADALKTIAGAKGTDGGRPVVDGVVADGMAIETALIIPSKPEAAKTVEDMLHRMKMDSELKKVVDSNKNFDRLHQIFKAIDLTLNKKSKVELFSRPEVPKDLWRSTVDTAVNSLRTEKDNLEANSKNTASLKKTWNDTSKLTNLITGGHDKKGCASKLVSSIEDLDQKNMVRLETMKSHIESLYKVDSKLRNYHAAVKSQILKETKLLQDQRDGNTQDRHAGLPKSSSRKTGEADTKPISLFGSSTQGSLFGAKSSDDIKKNARWDTLIAPASTSKIDFSLKPIQGTMIDRIIRVEPSLFGGSHFKSGPKMGSKLQQSQPRRQVGASSSGQIRNSDIFDFLSTYFALKQNQADTMQKRVGSLTVEPARKSGLSIRLDFLDSSYDDKVQVRSLSTSRSSLTASLLHPEKGRVMNVERQLKDFETLIKKNIKMQHAFDLSLRKQLIEEAEQERARSDKAYAEQAERERALLAPKNAVTTAGLTKPVAATTSSLIQEKKQNKTVGITATVGAKPEEKTDSKGEASAKTSATPALGGIFGGAAKGNGDADKDTKLVLKTATSTLIDKDVKDFKPDLFGKLEDTQTKKSEGLFGKPADTKAPESKPENDKKPATSTGIGLFAVNKPASGPKPAATLFGASTGQETKPLFVAKTSDKGDAKPLFEAPNKNRETITEQDEDDEPDNFSVTLKHSISQLGDSKAPSKQTDQLSKKESEMLSTSILVPKQSEKLEGGEANKPSGSLYGLTTQAPKESLFERSLFSNIDKTGENAFASMTDSLKTDNIFGGTAIKPSGEILADATAAKLAPTISTTAPKSEDKLVSAIAGSLQIGSVLVSSTIKPTIEAPKTGAGPTSIPSIFGNEKPKPSVTTPTTAPTVPKPAENSPFALKVRPPGQEDLITSGRLFGGMPAGSLLQGGGLNAGSSQLNFGSSGFGGLFTGGPTPAAPAKPAFGQPGVIGGGGMGSTGFGGGGPTTITPINFGVPTATTGTPSVQAGSGQNIFMPGVQTSNENMGWLNISLSSSTTTTPNPLEGGNMFKMRK